jgi:hypothetical protein
MRNLNRKLVLEKKRENPKTVVGQFSAGGHIVLAQPRGENGLPAIDVSYASL